MMDIERYKNWEGTIEELAETSASVLEELGQAHITPPNVRLIRDYAQRGILSQAERRGREVYYGFQQLNELVAAKVLVNEGVPLAKIADQFERDRDIVIMTLGVHAAPPPRSAARERWENLSEEPKLSIKESRADFATNASTTFMQRTIADTGRKADLRNTLNRLGVRPDRPNVKQIVRISITPTCSLHIERKYLKRLTSEEAEDIGSAVTALLSDPNIKRGANR